MLVAVGVWYAVKKRRSRSGGMAVSNPTFESASGEQRERERDGALHCCRCQLDGLPAEGRCCGTLPHSPRCDHAAGARRLIPFASHLATRALQPDPGLPQALGTCPRWLPAWLSSPRLWSRRVRLPWCTSAAASCAGGIWAANIQGSGCPGVCSHEQALPPTLPLVAIAARLLPPAKPPPAHCACPAPRCRQPRRQRAAPQADSV